MVVLVAFEKERLQSSEAGLKYLLLSAMSLWNPSLRDELRFMVLVVLLSFTQIVSVIKGGMYHPILMIGTILC